jgi:hypothetical protein
MPKDFTIFLVFGCVCAFLAIVTTIAGEDTNGRSLAGFSYLFLVLAGVFLGGAFYIAGQVDKTLPNLRAHHCTEVKHLEYKVGENYHQDAAKLIRAQHNSRCKGSIIIQYPGNPPITIPLK